MQTHILASPFFLFVVALVLLELGSGCPAW